MPTCQTLESIHAAGYQEGARVPPVSNKANRATSKGRSGFCICSLSKTNPEHITFRGWRPLSTPRATTLAAQ